MPFSSWVRQARYALTNILGPCLGRECCATGCLSAGGHGIISNSSYRREHSRAIGYSGSHIASHPGESTTDPKGYARCFARPANRSSRAHQHTWSSAERTANDGSHAYSNTRANASVHAPADTYSGHRALPHLVSHRHRPGPRRTGPAQGRRPCPGRAFGGDDPVYITPDIYVYKVGDEFHVVLNEDGLPKLRVSRLYRDVMGRGKDVQKGTREYVQDKVRSAMWLIKSIHQRQRTIYKVMHSIIKHQREFFEKGISHLKPLNLRDVADDIEMHESTVSRVTTNKYTHTPQGIFELKYFFNSSISRVQGDAVASESVKDRIRRLVANEDARRPLSDQRIAEMLRVANIDIARRTVTKYRESMNILSSTKRRDVG